MKTNNQNLKHVSSERDQVEGGIGRASVTSMKVRWDPTCPICQEEEETALNLLGKCSAL